MWRMLTRAARKLVDGEELGQGSELGIGLLCGCCLRTRPTPKGCQTVTSLYLRGTGESRLLARTHPEPVHHQNAAAPLRSTRLMTFTVPYRH